MTPGHTPAPRRPPDYETYDAGVVETYDAGVVAAPQPRLATRDCLSCAEAGRSVLASHVLRLAMGERSGTVDLCDDHLVALRAVIEPVLAASARRARRRPADTAVPRLRAGEEREVIRRWAYETGLPVSSTGTISSRVLEQYRVTHTDDGGGSDETGSSVVLS